ncbi:MAG: alpha-E domain-containing protein [Chloroflexi bacterium]|nr:alpha-E domain-containing protein [Chloroflexota bacterium]
MAESLYWMARYIERAEDLTRLLAVNFNALLDTQPEYAQQGWQPLVTMTGDEALFTEVCGEATAQAVMEFMLWHPLNPNAITTCILRARENARGVREQISSEMWEHINRLYFLIRDTSRATVLASPSEFFRQVRDGSQAFQGITTATMTHGEPYHFMQLGMHLERADKTIRILNAKYLYIDQLSQDSAEASLQLVALLRSCSAFEPFRRAANSELNIELVVDFLLLDRLFPRAALFCLNQGLSALDILGGNGTTPLRPANPRRTLGRVTADLEYLDIHEVLGAGMDPYLHRLLLRLNAVGDDIAQAYFTTRVILPDSRPQQQQQQQ